MRQWTQSNVDPGNCWQTAVACILDVMPERLPDQVGIEAAGRSYLNALNAYLGKHHGLMYSELFDYQFAAIEALREPGWHILSGPTERTPTNDRHHVVVAQHGRPVWDPHPSRAGLTSVERWGILAPLPARIVESRERFTGAIREEVLTCSCADCSTLPISDSRKEGNG